MSYQVRFTRAAREDLQWLYEFLLDHDLSAARRAREVIGKSMEFLRDFPFSCRKPLPDNPFLREMVIPFGASGYVALFEIEENKTVTVLAIRHQHEDDYH
jgi:plasmid stabilization system protein ParE